MKKQPIKAIPRDERKLFFAASYKLVNNKLKVETFISKNDDVRDIAFDSKDEAIAEAREYLSRRDGYHQRYSAGVVVFESVALVKPKPIEVELEEVKLIG